MPRRETPWRCARARMAWGVALSIAAHAAIAAITWRGPAPNAVPPPARLQVRLLERAAPLAPAGAARAQPAVKIAVAAPRRKAAVSSPVVAFAPVLAPVLAPALAAASSDPETEPAAPAQAISGAVFGLPRIGFGGPPSTTWMRASTPAAPPPQFAQPDPMAQAHEARQAGRAHLMAALEQQLGALPTPLGSRDGWCALGAQEQPQLECDSNALRDAITARADALSGLLHALRGIDSDARSLSIGFSQGRYQVSLATCTEPR